MISKAQIKLIQSLRNNKGRIAEGLFVVEGVKMLSELIDSKQNISKIFATEDWKSPLGLSEGIVNRIEDFELEKISNLTTPNQVLAIVSIPENKPVTAIGNELVLFLDQISDPGNMGTIIRTAEWFGINKIVASENSVDFWNPKVVQASMGSIFRIPLHKVHISEFFSKINAIPVYGTFFDGERLEETTLSSNGIIVIGSESHGISKEIEPFITRKLTISASMTSRSESLNASIATAIVSYEFRKQFPQVK